jgi:UDP-N-acetylmuramoylalanine--D-glutamate ligase
MNLHGKRALVMGLGVHGGGLGVARFLVERGADVTVTDLRDAAALQPTLDALAGLPIHYVLGQHREEDFRAADLVVRNPGVPRESRFLQVARAAGASVEMEMTLFFRLCPGPILGITGTKGKTTTTMLTGAMLREQFPDTVIAGNLRVSALEQLPKIGPQTPVVLELSSWQLEGLGEATLSPQYACITNISPDHLDRYGTMEAYAEAKAQIFLHQRRDDVVVLNADDPNVAPMAARAVGRVVWFGKAEAHARRDGRPMMVHDRRGVAWSDPHAAHGESMCDAQDIRLPGRHNLANIAAAAALARAFGVTNENIRKAVRNFTGVPDRLEFVREVNGVRYINDTTATAPEAAIAALHSFDAPIVLIAGGADKQLPFDDMARAIGERAKAVVLLNGTATPKLQSAISSWQSAADVQGRLATVEGPFDDFEQAVRTARDIAEAGDVVLLSPGCASFGMFRNEFHRGEEFRRIVKEL